MTTNQITSTITCQITGDIPIIKKGKPGTDEFSKLICKVVPNTSVLVTQEDIFAQFWKEPTWYGFNGSDAVLYPMRTARCHENCEMLLFQQQAQISYSGIALSKDGIWRAHSWCVNSFGYIIETTEPRLFYLHCGVSTKREDRKLKETKFMGDGLTIAAALVYNHRKGTKITSCATGNTIDDAQSKIKSELEKRGRMVCARQIGKARKDATEDYFIHVVFEEGIEHILIYYQFPYKEKIHSFVGTEKLLKLLNPSDANVTKEIYSEVQEKIKIELNALLQQFLFYDHCFFSECFNQQLEFAPEAEYFVLYTDGKSQILDYETRTPVDIDQIKVYGMPDLPPYFHRMASAVFSTLKVPKLHQDGKIFIKTSDVMDVTMEHYVKLSQLVSGHCGCKCNCKKA